MEKKFLEEREKLRMPEEMVLSIIERETKGPKSKEILKKALKYESPGHLYYAVFRCPLVYESGKGAIITDVDGNEYIDLISGWSTQNFGNCHPKIVQAIQKQAERLLTNAELPCEHRTELAKRLAEIAPGHGAKKVHFLTTGGEAVEVAVKLAKYYAGKPDILAFTGGYHGRTFGAASLSANAYFRLWDPTLHQIYRLPYAYCYRCFFGKEYPDCDMQCVRYIEMLFEAVQGGLRDPEHNITTVAGIVVEPMQCHAGYIVPPEDFLRGLRKICDRYNILLIVDEIQTGWGRSGKMWGCEHAGIEPDIMAIAKSLGGGIPISATIAKSEIFDSWGPAAHGTTFGGTPLACATGLAVLDIFREDKLVEQSARKGEYFLKRLEELQEKHQLIGHVDGRGLLIGIEFVKNRKTKEPAAEETEKMQHELFKRGVLIEKSGYYGNRFNFIPALVITETQIDNVIDALDQTMKTITC